MAEQAIELNEFQQKILQIPEEYDVFLGGGRGGGKSWALALIALRHVEQYGNKARVLYVRRSYKGLADFELVLRELFSKVYGSAASYNATEHVWRMPSGAIIELAQLETHADFQKFQGRSQTLLLADEVTQYATPDLIDLLRSNLRGPKHVAIRAVFAGNPGNVGHMWVAKRFVFVGAPWQPFLEVKSKRQFVYAPSTFAGNTFIDREQYLTQLESSCPQDAELLRAWRDGDWTVNKGAFFASVLDENRNAFDPWTTIPKNHGYQWENWISHDFGSSSPSATYLFAKSPGATVGGKLFPRGSLLVFDEYASAQPDRPNVGMGYTIPILAERIIEMCKRWNVRAEGVADDACFAKGGHMVGSVSDEFRRCGVTFLPARKADRLTGWSIMRRMLADAGKVDMPGLYFSRNLTYLWETLPFLGRDLKHPEDLDSSSFDHAADAIRYGILKLRSEMKRVKLGGI